LVDVITHLGGALHLVPLPDDTYLVTLVWVPVAKRSQGIGSELVRQAQALGKTLVLSPDPSVCREAPRDLDWLEEFYEWHGFEYDSRGFYRWVPD
jgi:predicted GNAT family N-acyltransferase